MPDSDKEVTAYKSNRKSKLTPDRDKYKRGMELIMEAMGATPTQPPFEVRKEENYRDLEGLTRYTPITEDPITGASVSMTEGGYPAYKDGSFTLGSYFPAYHDITYYTPIVEGSTTIPHERLHSAFNDVPKPGQSRADVYRYGGGYAGQFDWRDDQDPELYPPRGLTVPAQHNMIDMLLNETPEMRNDAMNMLNQVPTPNRGTLKQIQMTRGIVDQHDDIINRYKDYTKIPK